MNDNELEGAVRRHVEARSGPAPVPTEKMWTRIQGRRSGWRRIRRSWRRAGIGVAIAASLALLAGGIVARRRADHRRPGVAMTTASASVIQHHLAQSDTMIGAFRSAVASGTWDDQLTARARDLELATRRIQSGRITVDSTLAGLLADLDLVFTEIAGYGDLPAQRDTESEMIEYSIAEREVVPRLRAARAVATTRGSVNEGLDP